MKKLTDQELDSLFRNASENFSVSFDAAAWESMSAKLDQPRSVVSKKMIWILTGAILIFLSGIWVGVQISNKSTRDLNGTLQNHSIQNQKELDTFNALTTEPVNHNKDLPATTAPANSDEGEQGNQIDYSSASGVDESPYVLPDFKIQHQAQSSVSASSKYNPEVLILGDDKQDADNDSSVLREQHKHKVEHADSTHQIIEPEKQTRAITKHGVFVRAMASPDVSSINFSSSPSIGTNYGILLEYQLNNSFSIASGAIWSLKKYATSKELSYSGHSTNNLVGACRILEVPLTLYYHLSAGSKSSFYMGAGTSSYIMLREDYTYVVDYAYSSRTYQSRVERKNNEWFKIVNLSVGWQHHLSPKLDLLMEPFVRIPLTGIGEGNVELSSMGVFAGLKYKLK